MAALARRLVRSIARAGARARQRVATPVIGERIALPDELLERYPELRVVRWRRGGMPPRIGGWGLGQRTAAAITLWRTVYLAPGTRLDPALLLHELRHVHQFEASITFPVQYLWESVRRGYHRNRFETDAEAYAMLRIEGAVSSSPPQDV